MKFFIYLLVFIILIIGISAPYAVSQPPRQNNLPPLTQTIREVKLMLRSGENRSTTDRLNIVSRSANKLRPYGKYNVNIATEIRLVDINLKRRELLNDELDAYIERVRRSSTVADRNRAMRRLRGKLVERAYYLLIRTNPNLLTPENAQTLTDMVANLQAAYDMRANPLASSNRRQRTEAAVVANGIAGINNQVRNRQARRIIEGIRVSAPLILPTGASVPLGMPGAVTTAMNDVTLQGWNEATAAIGNLPGAFNGDPGALERINQSAGRLEQTLSRENWGNAMRDAIADTLLGNTSLMDTFRDWFSDDDRVSYQEGSIQITSPGGSRRNNITRRYVPISLSNFCTGKITVKLILGDGESGGSFAIQRQNSRGKYRTVANTVDVSPGRTRKLSHRFSEWGVYRIRLNGNWLSREGAQNSVKYIVTVRGK